MYFATCANLWKSHFENNRRACGCARWLSILFTRVHNSSLLYISYYRTNKIPFTYHVSLSRSFFIVTAISGEFNFELFFALFITSSCFPTDGSRVRSFPTRISTFIDFQIFLQPSVRRNDFSPLSLESRYTIYHHCETLALYLFSIVASFVLPLIVYSLSRAKLRFN